MASIEIQGIRKQYAGRTILSDLSLALQDGECFTLLGPSGCGKTVLLRLIAGARKRILITALYLQDDEAGREILTALHAARAVVFALHLPHIAFRQQPAAEAEAAQQHRRVAEIHPL